MQTRLSDRYAGTAEGQRVEALLGACVHCGFCNATCPTYRLTGNELEGPRGRLYLMKQVFEGGPVSALTRDHLDHCLGCRGCETTCPSGVDYSQVLDLGRSAVLQAAPRSPLSRWSRALLRAVLLSPAFKVSVRLAGWLRPLLPRRIQRQFPQSTHRPRPARRSHARHVLVPTGCVQPALMPGADAALLRVLDRLQIAAVTPPATCCGAIEHHTDAVSRSLAQARRNIDAWWPMVEAGVEAILWTASACALEVREYAERLVDDAAYAERAARISALVRDPGEFLLGECAALPTPGQPSDPVVFHPPCTLQHGLRAVSAVETLLTHMGATLLPFADRQLCCGSAGTYSLLQSTLANPLRDQKLASLLHPKPAEILSANVGCIVHLRGDAPVPVRHWLEWLDDRLTGA